MKKFWRKEQKDINDPIKYINTHKDRRFVFFTSWNDFKPLTKKRIKIASLVALPALAIALGTTLGVVTAINQEKDSLVNQIIIDENVVKRRVYLISEDNYTVPLTVSLDKKNNIHEEMLDVINLLKVSSKASNEYLHGFIPDECRVNSFTSDDYNNLTVDFSSEFLNMENVDELRVFEALSATLLQFENVNNVCYTVEGNKIETPYFTQSNNQSDIPYLNTIGVRPSILENKELVTVFYNRNYDQNHQYLIPISLYTEKGDSDNITFVNALFKDLPSYRQLKNLDLYNSISKEQEVMEEFTLSVNANALIDETTVNKDLYEIILLSLDLMGKETTVGFNIEGETLAVEGIYDEEDMAVGSIYYNETQI